MEFNHEDKMIFPENIYHTNIAYMHKLQRKEGGWCRKGLPPPHFFFSKNRRKKGIQDGRRTFIVDLAPLLKFASDNNEEYIFH